MIYDNDPFEEDMKFYEKAQVMEYLHETEEQIKARKHQEDLQRLRGFRPIDDDFMRAMFHDNLPLAQFVLRILLGKDDLVLLTGETQADMKRVTGAHSVFLDWLGRDSEEKIYDIEIQRADYGADPHRARYHSSVMDVENLDKNQHFSKLPDTWTIFITEKDFFGKGKPCYLFRFMDVETGEPLNDGATILYVNGAYRGDDPIGKLMHDFNCTDADEMHYPEMAERTKYLKESQGGVAHMCKVIEEMRKQEFAEGKAEGRVEGRILEAFATYREFISADSDIRKKVQDKFHLDSPALEHYWNMFIAQTVSQNG